MTAPLHGIRVLDLSRVLSGPSCGKALADLGADVVKVEPPEGDLTRKARPRRDGVAVYFAQQNCGKRCVSIDLSKPAGAALALDLAARCDVVLENFRPGVLDRLGLGFEAVRERNPGVVYCSITGYGQAGAGSDRRAYAPAVHAEMGLMEFFARKHGTSPATEVVSHADLYSGLQATVAILAALLLRARTGEGQRIDVAMADAMLQVNEWTAVELAGGGDVPQVFGAWAAPVLELGDGTVVCVGGDPVSSFPAWCEAMGRPELLDDERFATHAARDAHRADMDEILRGFARSCPSFEDFESRITRVRLAAGRVRAVAEAATDAWAVERGALVDVGVGAEVLLPRGAFRFAAAETGTRGRPAYQGEHNREVLRELLAMDDAAIDALEADGVLREYRVDAPSP